MKTTDDAERWTGLFLAWEAEFLHLTKERTYRKHATEIPGWIKPGQQWWYTHQRLRSGHHVFHRVIRTGHLFTFLDPKLSLVEAPATTNRIEGGVNAQMRLLLRHHRGLPEKHQRRAIEWWLYLHSEHPELSTVLTQHQNQPATPARPAHTEPDPGPVLYDTGISAEEGLWARSGWAGRG